MVSSAGKLLVQTSRSSPQRIVTTRSETRSQDAQKGHFTNEQICKKSIDYWLRDRRAGRRSLLATRRHRGRVLRGPRRVERLWRQLLENGMHWARRAQDTLS